VVRVAPGQVRPGRLATSPLTTEYSRGKEAVNDSRRSRLFCWDMIQPSIGEIKDIAEQGSVIAVCKDILGDLLTPAAAFLRVAHGRRRAFLLESVEGGERLARYSFVGWDPFIVVRGKGSEVSCESQGEILREETYGFNKLRQISQRFKPVSMPEMPPFLGGGVGYFAYDLIRQFEKLPSLAYDDLLG